MKNKLITTSDYDFFSIFSLFFIILGWIGFVLTLTGLFYLWIIIAYLAIGLTALLYYIFNKNKALKISAEFIWSSIIFILIVVIFSLFVTPTIFSGRDQGSISEAAIRLSQNHQLEFFTPASSEFFKIYGPGKALNFPGFHYTQSGNLNSQFPLPYISWLAIFYSIFGLSGLIIANAILFFLFLTAFYLLLRLFLNMPSSILTTALLITFFPFFWFFKFTLSENIALALAWIGILHIILFIKNERYLYFAITFFSFGLLAFARIEGFALLATSLIVIMADKGARKFVLSDKLRHIYIPGVFLFSLFIISFVANFPFLREMGRVLLKSQTLSVSNGELLSIHDVFLAYAIVHFVFLGIVGIVYLAKNKKYPEVVPFLITIPIFIYLLNPHISSDHPWMLRRFVFAIFPALILYSALLIFYWLKKRIHVSYGLMLFLILINLPLFVKYFSFSENKYLLQQTETLSHKFSDNDLVLIDRLASGDGWSMISGPMNFLYNKNAVYFFNPKDLNKINLEKFDKIYLVTSDQNIDFYKNSDWGNRIKPYDDYKLSTYRVSDSQATPRVNPPAKKYIETSGKIFEIEK